MQGFQIDKMCDGIIQESSSIINQMSDEHLNELLASPIEMPEELVCEENPLKVIEYLCNAWSIPAIRRSLSQHYQPLPAAMKRPKTEKNQNNSSKRQEYMALSSGFCARANAEDVDVTQLAKRIQTECLVLNDLRQYKPRYSISTLNSRERVLLQSFSNYQKKNVQLYDLNAKEAIDFNPESYDKPKDKTDLNCRFMRWNGFFLTLAAKEDIPPGPKNKILKQHRYALRGSPKGIRKISPDMKSKTYKLSSARKLFQRKTRQKKDNVKMPSKNTAKKKNTTTMKKEKETANKVMESNDSDVKFDDRKQFNTENQEKENIQNNIDFSEEELDNESDVEEIAYEDIINMDDSNKLGQEILNQDNASTIRFDKTKPSEAYLTGIKILDELPMLTKPEMRSLLERFSIQIYPEDLTRELFLKELKQKFDYYQIGEVYKKKLKDDDLKDVLSLECGQNHLNNWPIFPAHNGIAFDNFNRDDPQGANVCYGNTLMNIILAPPATKEMIDSNLDKDFESYLSNYYSEDASSKVFKFSDLKYVLQGFIDERNAEIITLNKQLSQTGETPIPLLEDSQFFGTDQQVVMQLGIKRLSI